MKPHLSEVDCEPGFTVLGYKAGASKKDRAGRPQKLTKAFASRSAAEVAAGLLRKGGAEVTGIREVGRPAA